MCNKASHDEVSPFDPSVAAANDPLVPSRHFLHNPGSVKPRSVYKLRYCVLGSMKWRA